MDWNLIDHLIQEKSLLRHHFYIAWSEGKLTLDDLRFYAGEYYALETTFPRLLSRIHSACDDPEIRQGILENLMDEEHGQNNHRELWLRFAEGLGLDREQVMNAPRHPATMQCIEQLKILAANPNPAIGLAALYAYESQLPAISRSKIAGLKDFYGINDPRAIEFFTVHEKTDVWHSEQEKSMLEALGATTEEVKSAVTAACDALRGFLDGVDDETRVKRLGVDAAEDCMVN